MGRHYRYEFQQGPNVAIGGFTTIADVPQLFLPDGLTLFIANTTTADGTFNIILLTEEVSAPGLQSLYVDPISGLSALPAGTHRAYRLPPCGGVLVSRIGGGGTVGEIVWGIGGITYSPYR